MGPTASPSAYGQTHAVPSVQDERDHKALLETLTNQVVPLYYTRDASGLPRGWIARQKNAFRTLAWRFNADRMVMDYVDDTATCPRRAGCRASMPAILKAAPRRERSGVLRRLGSGSGPTLDGRELAGQVVITTMIGEKLGSFRIEAILGSGAMGVVYRAINDSTGRQAAVKVVQRRARPERQASSNGSAARPRSSSSSATRTSSGSWRWGRFKGTSYFAMEYRARA